MLGCFERVLFPAVSRGAARSGAAGAYAILRRRDSRRVLAAKLATLADLDLDFLVVVNPGCQRQLMTAVRRARLRTKVVHLAEFVASAQADHR
jgi:glycolate oxidase iron-sulfur subunit